MKRIVLMYHDVYEKNPNESGFNRASMLQYKISKDDFIKQVEAVRKKLASYDGIEVVFTFDDGGVSFLSIVAPVLEANGLKGLFFISTKYLNSDGFLTKEQLIELDMRGHIIGSHSYSHPENLKDLSFEKQTKEWTDSFDDLQSILGHPIKEVSIPNGYYDKRTHSLFESKGIKNIYTSEPSTRVREKTGIRTYGRFVVHNGMTTEDVLDIVFSKRKRMILSFRWSLLNVLKIILGKNYNNIKQLTLKTK